MQVAQTVVLGAVDDDRIGVGDVDAVFDDGRRDQHVELAVDEIHDEPFELLGRHFAVTDPDPRLGADARNQARDGLEILHAVVDEIDLPAARQLRFDGIADDLLREDVRLGEDRLPVGRRRRDDRQVARPHERKLQRTRNGRRRERERVDIDAQLRELLLGRHAELLLLVDDQKPQIVEADVLAQHLVRADQNVDPSRFQIGENLLGLPGRFRTVQVFDFHRKVAQPLHERTVVLQRQNGRGNQYGGLLAVAGGLEGGADRHLRLAEAHVAANEPVHRFGRLHVALHGLDGRLLVGRLLVTERGF